MSSFRAVSRRRSILTGRGVACSGVAFPLFLAILHLKCMIARLKWCHSFVGVTQSTASPDYGRLHCSQDAQQAVSLSTQRNEERPRPSISATRHTVGSVKWKQAPPVKGFSAQILPACASIRALAMARPRPEPLDSPLSLVRAASAR